MRPQFSLGRLLSTPGALGQVHPEDMMAAIGRHVAGDWGELGDDDKQANEAALREGTRLLSSYLDRQGVKFWIITEWDRSATTVLLPSEY